MQKQGFVSTKRDSEDGDTCCGFCDHGEERQIWYQWHQEYLTASEERYKKKIQSLRAACRQQVRNLVVKLHREYEVTLKKLHEDYEKMLGSQKSTYLKTIIKLEKSPKFLDDVMLSDTDSEESDDSKIHEKCQSSYQELQSLLEEKEEEISGLKELLFLSENQEMSEHANNLDKQDFQETQKELKTASVQTEEVLHNQATPKMENLGRLSISKEINRNDSQSTLARKDSIIKELQEKIDRLNIDLLKSYKVNEDLHERVKMLQKSFNHNNKKSREANGPSHESIEHMKKIWKKKIMILQGSMHTLKNEMYLRQTLEKQAIKLHRAGISYTGMPGTPEEPFQAKLMSSGRNMEEQLHAKSNTSLPIIQDISQELSAFLAANGWWKQ